jgi:hypothetical protein
MHKWHLQTFSFKQIQPALGQEREQSTLLLLIGKMLHHAPRKMDW